MENTRPIMIYVPKSGWSHFSFDEDARVSYIDDMPLMVLEEAISAIENKSSFCVTFDAEGYEYTLLSYDRFDMECIMRKGDYPVVKRYDFSFEDFISWFVMDIEENIDDWAMFPAHISISDNEHLSLKNELLEKIEKLKKLLPEFSKLK